MDWNTFSRPIPLEELGWANTTYLGTGTRVWDPMIVWGTAVETDRLEAFVAQQRHTTGLIVSPAHVLVRAVAESLSKHPRLNRRVIGRRVHQYDGVNISMAMLQTRSGEVDTVFLRRAETMSLAEIAEKFWNEAGQKARDLAARQRRRHDRKSFSYVRLAVLQKLRMHWIHKMSWLGIAYANWLRLPTVWPWQRELNGAGASVNYFGFTGAPSMIMFKPSCLPLNAHSVSVTMGPSEPRPIAIQGTVAVRNQAPLYIRFDHRMANTFQAAAFISTLKSHLADPWTLLKTQDDVAKAA
jgi:hypothetical protein